ncbi:unnamed protein product [Caenorhabditis sp. 36 PRJEB53466]|nr:unnamed protein product [Caenorhabditis sp. 36 PRJEB53466]
MILQDVQQPTEGVKLVTGHVQALFKNDSLGNGTLYITNSAVTWINNAGGSKGFSISYPAIVLHAISTDLSVIPVEHVFVMVDQRKSVRRRRRAPVLRTIEEDMEDRGLELAAAELEDEESDDDEEGAGLEIRLVPDDKEALTQIYHEIVKGQEENPEEDDPMFDDDEEEEGEEGGEEYEGMEEEMGGGDGQWFTADNIDQMQMSEEGLANMQRIFGGAAARQNQNHDDSME